MKILRFLVCRARCGINVGSCGWGWIVIQEIICLFAIEILIWRHSLSPRQPCRIRSTFQWINLAILSTATNCRWIELQEIRATRYLHLISRKWAVNQKPKVFPSPLLVTLKKLIGIMIYSLHISSSGTCTFQDVYCREDMRFWQISCCYKLVIKTLRRQQLFSTRLSFKSTCAWRNLSMIHLHNLLINFKRLSCAGSDFCKV